MKALTLTQPWASLVAAGKKRIETRSWATSYRGYLAIHAAKAMPLSYRGLELHFKTLGIEPTVEVHGQLVYDPAVVEALLPRGAVVAVCKLIACVRIEPGAPDGEISNMEFAFGNYQPGRYAWFLAGVEPLWTPIPARGRQRLWDWKD